MGSLVAELAEKLSSATNNFDIDEGTIYVNTSADTVGIGTTTPASKLDVQGTMQVGVDDTGHDVKFFGATAGAYMLWDESQDDLIVGGTVSRVGIGITSPSFQLDLQNAGADGIRVAAYSTTASNTARLYLTHSNNGTAGSQTAVDAEDVLGQIIFQGSNGSAFVSGALIQAVADETFSGTAQGSYLTFNTVDNTTTGLDERMRIDHNGRVGIGTTNPYSALNVSDPAGTTTVIISDPTENDSGEHWYFRNTGGNFYIGQSTDGTGAWDSLAARMTFSDGGQVGIGTTAPSSLLTIRGSADNANLQTLTLTNSDWAANETSQSVSIEFLLNRGGTTDSAAGRIVAGKDNDYDDTASVDSNLAFYTAINDGNTEKMRILSNGNVGIGTTAPDELLHLVSSTSLKPVLKIENTNDDQHNPQIHLVKNPATGGAEADNDYLGQIDYKGLNDVDASPMTFGRIQCVATDVSDGTEDGSLRFETMSSGTLTSTMTVSGTAVGIMESTPLFALHVAGTLGIKTAQPTLTFDRGGAYAWTIRNGDGTGSFPLSTLNVANNSGSPVMTFKDDGKVGIGTSAPTEMLEIYNVNTPAIQLNDGGDYQALFKLAGNDLEIRGSSGSMEFYNGSADGDSEVTPQFKIASDGKLFSLPTYNNTTSGGANVFILHTTGEFHRSTSSRQYKTNISDSAKGLTELLTLRPVDFNSTCTSDDPNKPRTGFIAEEVAEAGFEEYAVRDEYNNVQNVEYGHMVALCVKSIQELSTKVTALENA